MIPLDKNLLYIAINCYYNKWFLMQKIDIEDFVQTCHEVNAAQYHKFNSDLKLQTKFETFEEYIYTAFTRRLIDELRHQKIMAAPHRYKNNELKYPDFKITYSDNLEIFNPIYVDDYAGNIIKDEIKKKLRIVINTVLTKREKQILRHLMQDKSLVTISKELSITQGRISQLKKQIYDKLRNEMSELLVK